MWRVALVACIVAFLAIWWATYATERWSDSQRKLDAVIYGQEAQKEIKRQHGAIDKDLKNGGEGNLSDYMRGAAGKLWDGP